MRKQQLIFLLSSTFLLVLAWISFNIYHNTVTSTIPASLGAQILPIPPTFDNSIINKIKSRKKIEPVYELKTALSPTSSPTPSILPTITPSLVLSPTTTATRSGGL